jgi:alkylation response protein AidB-like acyl-CoA dehydrogenase
VSKVACDFRNAVRQFLTHNDPGPAPEDPNKQFQWQRNWAATLVDNGFAAPAWPREHGGMGLSAQFRATYYQEFAKVSRPAHPAPGIFVVGMAIIRHGSEDQRRRHLRPGLSGDVIWEQGFVEPGVVELADAETSAERCGDEYVVTGTKICGPRAMEADWIYALVRTSDNSEGRNDLSYLLIELSSPGVERTRLLHSEGSEARFLITLDHVRVPVANRVGKEHKGWRVACTSMCRGDILMSSAAIAS